MRQSELRMKIRVQRDDDQALKAAVVENGRIGSRGQIHVRCMNGRKASVIKMNNSGTRQALIE